MAWLKVSVLTQYLLWGTEANRENLQSGFFLISRPSLQPGASRIWNISYNLYAATFSFYSYSSPSSISHVGFIRFSLLAFFFHLCILCMAPCILVFSKPDSSVSAVSGYGLDDRAIEVRYPAEAKIYFLYLLCPDRLWGPPSLLCNGYRRFFPRR
jgi:hypothetical protein